MTEMEKAVLMQDALRDAGTAGLIAFGVCFALGVVLAVLAAFVR